MLAVVVAALAGAAALRGPIEADRRELRLTISTSDLTTSKHPKIALLEALPGGIKAPFLAYLWIRSQQLKEQGKFYDAMGLRDMICDLMPHFPGVWYYHGWDMAWNISAATHTPEERWMWVHNGIRLLRDRGLRYNPDDLLLHRELSWIFFQKMGESMDEMHRLYKVRWLEKMEFVLGQPPLPEIPDSTQEGKRSEAGAPLPKEMILPEIRAFRMIAEAPPAFEQLSADAQAFAAKLAESKVVPGESFLLYYNRYSRDENLPARFARRPPQGDQPDERRERQVAEIMSDPTHAGPRGELLAFCRRKVLVEQYRMDPAWMLKLMERYGPLDWRHVMSHAMYWSSVGLHRAVGLELSKESPWGGLAMAEAKIRGQDRSLAQEGELLGAINVLNTERNVLNALKALAMTGQIRYDVRGREPIQYAPDWRFIEPAIREYGAAGKRLMESPKEPIGDKNALRNAQINFMSNAIQILYMAGRTKDAQRYYDQMRDSDLLTPTGEIYEKDLHDFVAAKISEAGGPTVMVALAFRHGVLVRAYRALGDGMGEEFDRNYNIAKRRYAVFSEGTGKIPRHMLNTFEQEDRIFLAKLLLDPRSVGMHMPLLAKVRIYQSDRLTDETRRAIYPVIQRRLRLECEREGFDFEKAFPAPLGVQLGPPAARAG